MEQKEIIASTNPLTAVLDEMRKPNPDVGQLGEKLFDLNVFLIPEHSNYIERARQAWRGQTRGGKINTGLVGENEQYQTAFSTLASLGKPDKPTDYIFYLQDSGLSRLAFAKNEQGQIVVEITYNLTPEVKEKFKQLSGETERLQLAVPSVTPVATPGLLERLIKVWERK